MSTATATGGSARSQAGDRDIDTSTAWRSNVVIAWTVRLVVFILPFVAGYLGGTVLSHLLPRPIGPVETIGWWQTVLIGSGVAVVGGRKLANLITPLSVLYKMSLVFPDAAPSRYRVALKRASARELARRVEAGEPLGATPAEAAENLLVLLDELNGHDRLTRGHSERVRAYSDLIAAEMQLPAADREKLHWAALIHDVGKLHVDGEILRKNGRPTDEEWAQLKAHPAAAATMLAPLEPWLGPWLTAATEHHERWDGGGYPYGKAGTQIGIAGRIVAVADAFDTMTSTRSYKKAWTAEAARAELVDCAGSQFDPAVVRAFLSSSVRQTNKAAGPLSWLAQTPRFAELMSTAGNATANVAARVGVVAATGAAVVPAAAVAVAPEEPVVEVAAEASDLPAQPIAFTETTTTLTVTSTASTTSIAASTTIATTTTTPASTTVAPSTTSPPPTTTTPTTTTATPTTTLPPTSTTTTTTLPPTTTTSAPPDQNVQWLASAPPSFANDVLMSNDHMFLYAEPGPTNFAAPTNVLVVDNTELRSITAASLGEITIDPAISICSVFVHLDPASGITLTSVVSVPGDVIGLISTNSELAATHYLGGYATSWSYDYFGGTDRVRRLGPRTLEIEGAAGPSSHDQLRIIHHC